MEISKRNTSEPENTDRSLDVLDFILRLLAIGGTLSAAIIIGTDKETALTVIGPITAKYSYMPSFIFFIVANAVACAYALASIIINVASIVTSRTPPALWNFLQCILDSIMMALLSSGASAAAAIAYVGSNGNSHSGWIKICNNFYRFCDHLRAALAASFAALGMFVGLCLLSSYNLYRRGR